MRRYMTGLVFLLLLMAGPCPAREGFVEVSCQDLLDYPQKYWSQSIIFQDELKAPPKGQTVTIASKRYVPFTTAELGTCYAQEDLADALRQAELNTRYLFQGTVLHQPSSFFSRSPSFYVVVQKFSRVVDAVGQVQEVFSQGATNLSPGSEAVIKRVQQDLINYARKNNLQMTDLFADNYTNAVMVQNVIYAGIASVEQQYQTTARKLLGDFIAEVFKSEFTTDQEITETETASRMTPAAEPFQQEPPPVVTIPSPQPAPESTPVVGEDRTQSLRQRAALLLKPGIRPSAPAATPVPEATPE